MPLRMAKQIEHETPTFCQLADLLAPKGYVLEAKMNASNSKDFYHQTI